MQDSRDPNQFDFSDMSDSPLNDGYGMNRDESYMRPNLDEVPLYEDENDNWWEDDDISWIGD